MKAVGAATSSMYATPVVRRFGATLLSCVSCAALTACSFAGDDAREGEIVASITRTDEPLLRARPALCAGKYLHMTQDAYTFFRGSLAVYKADWRRGVLSASRFSLDAPLVPSIGDAHPENFGTMRATDGTISLEANDFDAADQMPYLWDVRRLSAGFAVAAMLSNPEDQTANETATAARREIARGVAEGYTVAIGARARDEALPRITSENSNAFIQDLFRRSQRDYESREELAVLTSVENGLRRIRRGVLDPAEPTSVLTTMPPETYERIQDALERYRGTLVQPPPKSYLTLLDAAREFGSGVSSWAKVRALLLVEGPTADPSDDVVLELKELGDSTLGGLYPPVVAFNTVEDRVLFSARSAWGRPDAEPFWGTTTLLGIPMQIKREAEGAKNIRVSRMAEEEGSVPVLIDLARQLGALLARIHGVDQESARLIALRISEDPTGFADEQADVGVRYADQVIADFAHFQHAVSARGNLLGFRWSPDDAPPNDLAALYGTPPNASFDWTSP